jgi:hypothetical protein
MTMIPALRPQVAAPTPPPATKPDPGSRPPAVSAAAPVALPILKDAPGQSTASTATVPTRLAERNESNHPAAEARLAADAARKAYIKASIAAGVSPLPLP